MTKPAHLGSGRRVNRSHNREGGLTDVARGGANPPGSNNTANMLTKLSGQERGPSQKPVQGGEPTSPRLFVLVPSPVRSAAVRKSQSAGHMTLAHMTVAHVTTTPRQSSGARYLGVFAGSVVHVVHQEDASWPPGRKDSVILLRLCAIFRSSDSGPSCCC